MSSKQNSSTVNNIYRSRNIILTLLEKRGYDISPYEGISINDISKMCPKVNDKTSGHLDMLLQHKTIENKKCFIKYHLSGKIRPNHIYEYIDDLYNIEDILTKDDDFIIIVKDKCNDTLTKLLSTIWNVDQIYFSIYCYTDYLYNILEHELVPEHIVLNDNEKEEKIKQYNITNDKEFPEISRFDPVAQAIGLRPNKLCKIIRPSPTAINTEYFRICK